MEKSLNCVVEFMWEPSIGLMQVVIGLNTNPGGITALQH